MLWENGSPGLRYAPSMSSKRVVRSEGVAIGVVATPAAAAQEVCDRLVAAGVRSVLNFAPCVLSVPPGVDVRKVDLSTELQILAFHEQRRGRGGAGCDGRGPARPGRPRRQSRPGSSR